MVFRFEEACRSGEGNLSKGVRTYGKESYCSKASQLYGPMERTEEVRLNPNQRGCDPRLSQWEAKQVD